MKRPAFQFYPADWRKDNELQSCSIGARGLWIEMICIAHECEPYGRLVVNGRPMTDLQIARLVGISPREFASLLLQLTDAGVVTRDQDGALFSRRMVRDEGIREARAAGGAAGAEHGAKGAKDGVKGGRPSTSKGGKKPPLHTPLNPPPSSSTSSSSSPSEESFALRAETPGSKTPFEIPEWLPRDTWKAYLEMRVKMRKPMTPQAMSLAISKLRRMKGEGHDPKAILEQSILGSYQGLFPVKQENGGRHGSGNSSQGRSDAGSSHQRHLAGLAMLVDEADGRSEEVSESGEGPRRIAAAG